MSMTDEEREIFARKSLLKAAEEACKEGSTMQAVLLVIEYPGMVVLPLRLTRVETFSALVAACAAVEPIEFVNNQGELH